MAPLTSAFTDFDAFRPFSNSVFADPRFFANLGIAAPPNRRTASTMITINRSGPNISPTNMCCSSISASLRRSGWCVVTAVRRPEIREARQERESRAGVAVADVRDRGVLGVGAVHERNRDAGDRLQLDGHHVGGDTAPVGEARGVTTEHAHGT